MLFFRSGTTVVKEWLKRRKVIWKKKDRLVFTNKYLILELKNISVHTLLILVLSFFYCFRNVKYFARYFENFTICMLSSRLLPRSKTDSYTKKCFLGNINRNYLLKWKEFRRIKQNGRDLKWRKIIFILLIIKYRICFVL